MPATTTTVFMIFRSDHFVSKPSLLWTSRFHMLDSMLPHNLVFFSLPSLAPSFSLLAAASLY